MVLTVTAQPSVSSAGTLSFFQFLGLLGEAYKCLENKMIDRTWMLLFPIDWHVIWHLFSPHNSRSGFYKNVSKLLTLPGLCLPALSGLLCGCPHHGSDVWKSRHCQLFFSFYHLFQRDPSSGRRASAALKSLFMFCSYRGSALCDLDYNICKLPPSLWRTLPFLPGGFLLSCQE